MAGYVVSIAGAKGGVGKTTTAINLGTALTEDGYDVVVVDGDLKTPNLGRMLGLDVERGVHTVLSGDASVRNTLVEIEPGVSVMPGDPSLGAFTDTDPDELAGLLGSLRERFDVVVVDTGAGLTHGATVALSAADGVLCLSTPSSSSVDDAKSTLELVDRADGNAVGSLITCADQADEVFEVFDEFDVSLLGAVPFDREAASDEPVVHTHPDSDIAAAYGTLADLLARVMFEDTAAEDLGMAFVEEWFESDVEGAAVEDDDDESGAFGLF